MKLSPTLALASILIASAIPSWADPNLNNAPFHCVDMYCIYKVYDTPPAGNRQVVPNQGVVQPVVFLTTPQPFPAPTPTSSFIDDQGSQRDLTAVDDQLHRLHLLLNDELAQNQISADFYNEEVRVLREIEHRAQTDADALGGHLTADQENSLLDKLQVVENEINQTITNQG
jgi:hypothetical protein